MYTLHSYIVLHTSRPGYSMHLVWMHSAWEGKTGRATAWCTVSTYVRMCICMTQLGLFLDMHTHHGICTIHAIPWMCTPGESVCLYNMLWSVTVEQIVAWCGSNLNQYTHIDLNISCIYSGGGGGGGSQDYIYVSGIYVYTWEYESLHVSMSHIWWEVVGVVSHTWWDCGEWQGT